MVKKRLIACLLWREEKIVQSVQFAHTNYVGNAMTAVDFFNTWAIDEIVLLDVTRDTSGREAFHRDLSALSHRSFVPLAVGGWVRDVEEMRTLLNEGADKVVLNTEAFRNPDLITEGAKMFGNQCIVVSIDAHAHASGHEVYVDRGRQATGKTPLEWAKEAQMRGAGEIFLTSIDRDGMRNGYDIPLVRSVAEAVRIPVIASGGVGEWAHFVEGVAEGRADAVSAANIFHYSDQSTKKAKEHMKAAGVDVRAPEFYKITLRRNPQYRV